MLFGQLSGDIAMTPTTRLLRRATVSGTFASLVSTLALLYGGVRDCRSALAPVNAVSHWIWKDKAIRQHRPSMRYSAAGYFIHHAASIFWALAYEALLLSRAPKPVRKEIAASAAAVAALACVVDLRCTPERLTPGFERRLGTTSLTTVYAAFAIGLALHSLLSARDRR
jgi:hypothetical protein